MEDDDCKELIAYFSKFQFSRYKKSRIPSIKNSVKKVYSSLITSPSSFPDYYFILLEKLIYYKSAVYFPKCWYASPKLFFDGEVIGGFDSEFFSSVIEITNDESRLNKGTIFNELNFPFEWYGDLEYIKIIKPDVDILLNCENCPDVSIFKNSLLEVLNGSV